MDMESLTTLRSRSPSPPYRQADEIRSRLLNKLGIYNTKLINASICQRMREQKRVHPILLSQESLKEEITSIRFVEPLKFSDGRTMAQHHDYEQSDGSVTTSTTSSSSSSTCVAIDHEADRSLSRSIQDPPASLISRLILEPDPALNKRRRSVHFNHEVSVVPIPSRTCYTPYTHSRLFIGKKEMIRNARRNEREFVYENFDWRNAVEEDQMYSNLQMDNEELVHPANYVCSPSCTPYPLMRGGT